MACFVNFQEKTYLYRTSLYLAASASAEFFADIALCPMEAVKVRLQTQPGWANTLREGFPKLMAEEGVGGWVTLTAWHFVWELINTVVTSIQINQLVLVSQLKSSNEV